MEKTRPKHLDLPKIRLPIPGIVSILHRVSGILMFVAIPFVLALLAGSLSSQAQFDAYRAVVAMPLVKLMLLALLWAFLHHACAGVRFLLLDIHKGLELDTARATAKAVMVVSLVLTAVIGGVLW
jgi:succinate dehydrogenase / fumarate reductase cytochrome b subunit